jgi:hypothetical protein
MGRAAIPSLRTVKTYVDAQESAEKGERFDALGLRP